MAAGINDKFKKVSADNSYAVATTVKTARTVGGGTTLEAFDLSKWADQTAVNFLTYRKTTDPVTNITTVTNRTGWTALVNTSSNTLTNLTIAPGYTDLGHQVGDYIEPVPTSKWANDLVDGILVSHNQDGTLKNKVVGASNVDLATLYASGMWWEELGRAKLGTDITNGTFSLTVNLPPEKRRKYYKVLARSSRGDTPTGERYTGIRINGDDGANYKVVAIILNNSATVSGQFSNITYASEASTYEYATSSCELDVFNPGGGSFPSLSLKGNSPTYTKIGSGWWMSGATITSFTYVGTAAKWQADTELVVLGHD